jgi:hypothetical protein
VEKVLLCALASQKGESIRCDKGREEEGRRKEERGKRKDERMKEEVIKKRRARPRVRLTRMVIKYK